MTRLPAAERRTRLIAAATRVIAREGVSAATTRAIVAEADMPLASFHYAFASRDELMAEVVRTAIEQEQGALQPALDPAVPAPSVRDAVRAGLEHYFRSLTADPDRERAMLELTQYALRSTEITDLARRQYERYHALAADTLEGAATLTGRPWRIPVADLARLLVSFTDGLTMCWLVDRDDDAAARTMDLIADTIAGFATETEEPRT